VALACQRPENDWPTLLTGEFRLLEKDRLSQRNSSDMTDLQSPGAQGDEHDPSCTRPDFRALSLLPLETGMGIPPSLK